DHVVGAEQQPPPAAVAVLVAQDAVAGDVPGPVAPRVRVPLGHRARVRSDAARGAPRFAVVHRSTIARPTGPDQGVDPTSPRHSATPPRGSTGAERPPGPPRAPDVRWRGARPGPSRDARASVAGTRAAHPGAAGRAGRA